jgi:hemerythrin-like domain-containing protein
MSALETWQKDHEQICKKNHILEKALLNLLHNQISQQSNKPFEEQKSFIEAFQKGLKLHFAVEEKAFFPEIRKMGQPAEELVEELLQEHETMLEQCQQSTDTKYSNQERTKILLKIAAELEAHAQKEETHAYPFVKQMSHEQLEKIDQAAHNEGYTV